jgi:hypothetical protein
MRRIVSASTAAALACFCLLLAGWTPYAFFRVLCIVVAILAILDVFRVLFLDRDP